MSTDSYQMRLLNTHGNLSFLSSNILFKTTTDEKRAKNGMYKTRKKKWNKFYLSVRTKPAYLLHILLSTISHTNIRCSLSKFYYFIFVRVSTQLINLEYQHILWTEILQTTYLSASLSKSENRDLAIEIKSNCVSLITFTNGKKTIIEMKKLDVI